MTQAQAPWWVAGQHLTTATPAVRQARFAHKAATTARTATTTMTDDPELLLTLPAGLWELRMLAFFGATTGSLGVRVAWGFTAAPVGAQNERISWGPSTGATSRTATNGQTRATPTTSSAVVSLSGPRLYGNDDGITSYATILEEGLVALAETSTWSIQWAQHTSHADATQVRASSYIKATPMQLLETS